MLNAFRDAVAAEPNNAHAKVRWGRLLLERFNPAEASGLFQEALAVNSNDPEALLGLALVASDSFEGSAAGLARQALKADPKLTEAQELLARLALEESDANGAREEADRALKLDAHSLTAEAVHASADLVEHRPADTWLNRMAQEHPSEGRGYELIGYFLQINRRYEDGDDYFRKAIAVQPNLWSAHSELGLNLMRLGQEADARKELELCYANGYRDNPTVNTLRLMDSYKNFRTFRTGTTILRLHEKEADVLRLYMEPEMQRALAAYQKKYEYKLSRPVQLEVYPDHDDFAVRTMGMPGLGLLGVTFQDVVAMDSPSGRPPGDFHWAATMWHELSHVYVLSITNQRVPRWFTEGVAVHEETQASPDWGDRLSPDVILAIKTKKLLPVEQLDRGFIHPQYPNQVVVSYYEAGKICDFISQKWGEHKLLDMVHAFAKTDSVSEVIAGQLGIKPEEFDREFLASLDRETKTVVDNFDKWQADMKALHQAVRAGNGDEILSKAKAVHDEFSNYVDPGDAYEAVAGYFKSKGMEDAEANELREYSRAGGRNPTSLKELATLLSKQGKAKESAEVLERLIYITPLDEELHTMLGERYLALNDAGGAIREYRALVLGKAPDAAAAHYGLARALHMAHKDAEAKDELLECLEGAPGFKPAQRMLLEMTANPSSD